MSEKFLWMPSKCRPLVLTGERMSTDPFKAELHNLFASKTVICRCGSDLQNAGVSFIRAVHAQSSTSGRPRVLFALFPFVNQAGSKAFDFFTSPAFWHSSNDVRQVPSLTEHPSGQNHCAWKAVLRLWRTASRKTY